MASLEDVEKSFPVLSFNRLSSPGTPGDQHHVALQWSLPPGSPCSSSEVPSQTADPDLQDIEEVKITRDTWLGE
uniref:Uncharacterized protein n=1 Tax=Mus spicilegus TaxID=10103 RepID=A0A8C6HRV1_MUSSI